MAEGMGVYKMKAYVCPMHLDIQQDTPGTCSICGMKLVPRNSMEKHSPPSHHHPSAMRQYLPLITIIGLISATALTLTLRDMQQGMAALSGTISYFMIGFFLVFSGFKLIDLKGFAEGYSTYDLLAQRWYAYGYIYPFLELFFGLAMILWGDRIWLLWMEIIVMVFSGIGVAIKIARREKFQCACLGTFLKVPLTSITLVEDFGMALLAALLLLLA